MKLFWLKDIPEGRAAAYRPYFRYYATECRRLRFGISKESWQSSTMVTTTHKQNLLIARILCLQRHSCKPKVRELIRQQFPNAEDIAINRSIDFALRTWLTINVREECFSLHTPRTPTIQWDERSSLADFVVQNFPHAKTSNSLQLDHTFTAANISRLSGIDIEWTPMSCRSPEI